VPSDLCNINILAAAVDAARRGERRCVITDECNVVYQKGTTSVPRQRAVVMPIIARCVMQRTLRFGK
jgi:hypothetical protein